MNHVRRLERLMGERIHPLLVTDLANIRYLTGFAGTSAFLLVEPERTVFITDGRYMEVAEALIADLPATELRRHTGNVPGLVAEVVDAETVDVEADHVSWAFARRLSDQLDARVTATTGIVEALRRVKDDDEVAALEAAAQAGDAAFARVHELAAAASDEATLGYALITAMQAAGGTPDGWPPIVATGPNAARPHHRSGDGLVGDGLLLLDYGCTVDGYHSDMTRTVWLGEGSDPELEKVHAAVRESNEAGIAATGPGVPAHDVDDACRAVLRTYGYEEYFVHSTGHGVGLDIHEGPSLKKNSEDVLEPGNVVTVEPGVYLPGRGGVRIEDMVLVTESGRRVLTGSPKGLRP